MDLSKDDQTPAQTTDSQMVSVSFSAHKDGIEAEPLQPNDESTDSLDLKCSVHSLESSQWFSCCSAPSLEEEIKVCLDSSKPESQALPLPPQLCHAILTTQSTFTDIKQEPSHPSSLIKDVSSPESSGDSISVFSIKHSSFIGSSSTRSDSLDGDAIVGPVSDLYIYEGDTHDVILSQTADPKEIACREYQPLLGTEEKADHDFDPRILMCDSADTVTQCHGGFSEEQALLNDVSEASQHEELRPPAGDVWEVDLMLGSDISLGKAEVTHLDIQLPSDSPVELWLDARQYLTDEDKEDLEVLDRANPSVIQGAQVSDYAKRVGSPSDDIRGRGPVVERWSSVDSWASALSDWTGIIEDPSEDIAAVFAEIGAEIDALTQSLDELNSHTEPKELQEDLKTTVQEQAQEIMGVQDQPITTQTVPESSFHSDQSCCSLCLEATGPELQDNIGSKCVECSCDLTAKREQKPEEMLPMSSAMALASPGGSITDVTELTLNVAPCDLNLYQSDGRSKSFEEDVLTNSEDHPIKLNITEDTDVNVHAKLVIEEQPYEHGLSRKTGKCSLWLRGSVAEREETCEENKPPTDSVILGTHHPTDPGVETPPDRHTDVSQQKPFGESQVEQQSGKRDFIMCLAPLGSEPPLVCETHSSLEGESLNNCLDCGHVQLCPPCPPLDEVTAKPFLESDEELIHKKQSTINAYEKSSPDGRPERRSEDSAHSFINEITDLTGDLLSHPLFPADYFLISEKQRVACIALNLNDPFIPWTAKPIFTPREPEQDELKMPHKTSKNPPEGKTRPKKEKSGCHHHGASKKLESPSHHVSTQGTCKQLDVQITTGENPTREDREDGIKEGKTGIESHVGVTEKGLNKPHSKKKKKHGHTATIKSDGEPPVDVGDEAKPKTTKGRVDMFEAKLGAKTGKTQREMNQSVSAEKKSKQPEDKVSQGEKPQTDHKDVQTKDQNRPPNDETVKRRRMSGDKFGKIASNLESRLLKTDVSVKAKEEEAQGNVGAARKKAYSEVVKQKTPPKEGPEVVQPIQAVSVSEDPQSLCLQCQFAAIHSDYTVTWSREGAVLAESKRSAGDEKRVSLTIANASHKDLGRYECRLSSFHGSVTLDYLLTYEVLSEIVIPESPKTISSPSAEVCNEEEDAHYSKLLFKQDFLSEQYFGENLPISIVTEKVHFGEGMHRRAFRTKLKAGQIPLLVPGHACVLKVHNAISYGTKNNDELIERNFNLAVEECQVQNTAREYIKDYTSAALSVEAFGDIPEIIPIYLVHRPSNDIPYATLEEELIGDFVKYSVKDGKEINLLRRDSEAGQKCCAFQHWVYQKTEGNLLVTDMQGVGMKLTDVGIATCKKGYKGFKGNCSTSFIDQFKALHQCNKYCEILGLKSLQTKAKKPPAALKPKPQPSAAPKKKTFGPTVKGKS